MTRKAFTVEEANAMVTSLNELFQEVRAHRHAIREAAKKIDVLELVWGSSVRESSNPDFAEFVRLREDVDRAMRGIQRVIEEGVIARGLRLPAGGIENGLVDFPTTYHGRWVYLCWKVGERELLHWHEADTGFSGRNEITDADRAEMGLRDSADVDDSDLDFPEA
jgi:hypothetical protein